MKENLINMAITIIILALLTFIFLTMTGCTLISPTNELRVTEYDGSGVYATATGEARGVRVTREQEVKGCLTFSGNFSTYASEDCK